MVVAVACCGALLAPGVELCRIVSVGSLKLFQLFQLFSWMGHVFSSSRQIELLCVCVCVE